MKDIPLARLCSKDYIRTVGRAWEKFVTDRPVEDDDVVRDVVIESWHRCRRNGVNPATLNTAANGTNGVDGVSSATNGHAVDTSRVTPLKLRKCP